MENNLPKEWESIPLKDIVFFKKGKKPKRMALEPFDGSVTYLDIKAIEMQVNEIFVDIDSSKITDDSELVLVWDGARAGWIGKSRYGALGSTLMALKPLIDKLYLYRFIQIQFNYLQNNHRGTGIPHIDPDILWNISVPIPPLSEQHRIVAKLDALFEKIESNKKHLEKIPQILKRFRQSVLAAAVSGKLTEDWREKNGAVKEWSEVELNTVIPKGGLFDGPFGSNLKTNDYTDKGIRVIRLENIGHLHFKPEKETYITEEKYQSLIRHTVGEGDIIISSFIAEEIRACILPKLSTKAIAKADCFCLRPDDFRVDRFYLLISLISIRTYEQFVSKIHGATRPRINTTQLKSLNISLPNIEEQKEISKRVKKLFNYADKIEARYAKVKNMLDKLPQSILAKAFRGELVAQDPNDEPTSVLLEIIKAEKEKVTNNKKNAKQKGKLK